MFVRINSLIANEPQFWASDDVVEIEYGDPAENCGRVRKVVRRSNTRSTHKMPSIKLRRMVHCESGIELKQAKILDVHAGVKTFQENGCIVHYTQLGELKRHYVDFHVQMHSGFRSYIESKSDEDAKSASVAARTTFLTDRLARLGILYRVVTESELDKSIELANACFIKNLANYFVTEPEAFEALTMLASLGTASLNQLSEIDSSRQLMQTACYLVARGDMRFPDGVRIDMDTPMELAK